ncbi:phosphoglycerate kinase, partial [Patescibacteria group bacterium]|nr:phosphoglycerate kinase [Patescibacteria group bacterium]MBU1921766.1 phosphoglycerate kinase [Patescibacteria group bacterium]
ATSEIARAIAKSRAKTYVGGGETLMAINKLRLLKKYTFVSTGGGAMLEFFEGKELPGLKPLSK